ncbi:MAG: LD-carboxypeptidase [Bacteroidota bacterium]
MIKPISLIAGDSIGIVATARKIDPIELKAAVKVFTKWKLQVKLAPHLYDSYHQFGGTDEVRVLNFQTMLDNPEIKAIVCARGGYGTIRILDKIDFSRFIENPKWIVGFSDITVIHSFLQEILDTCSIHATMPFNFPLDASENDAVKSLKQALFGFPLHYEFPSHHLNRQGNMEGVIVGGNLSVLASMMGSPNELDTRNKVLFIEDIDEYLYHIDRMMINLKRCGMLNQLLGLVIGGMTDMKDNTVPFGMDAYEIIADSVKEYNFPICFDFPAGHIEENMAIIMGEKVSLQIDKNRVVFTQKT